MEIPEKIYISPNVFNIGENATKVLTTKYRDNVEYIRTDAFIEKAYDFIHRKICDYIVHYNYGPNNDMETMYVDSRFFDDFKNYIKD